MLVLSRKDGESIRIGSDVIVKVSKISGGRVKLAIEAPNDVRIQRGELGDLPESKVPSSNTATPPPAAHPVISSPSATACA
jgi:carbon storage regulator